MTASRPHLSAAYVALALRLQESAPDLSTADAKSKLVAALMDMSLVEVGKRNSANDQQVIQTIHDHATALGATCSEPDMKEAAKPAAANPVAGSLKLVESFDWREQALDLIEASGNPVRMKIKLIAPGKGASAFYPAEVLKRDGPKVFTKGTHIYINHATKAEEAARPEGDWHKLAGALDGPAYWDESAKQGPGLYGDGLFTSDYAPLIKEKASFTGMSIKASGNAESGKTKDGRPVLKELTSAESVDIVTRPGAGGMILTEAARPQPTQEVEMEKAEITALVAETVKAVLAESMKTANPTVLALEARAIRGDAREAATKLLESFSIPPASKSRVIFEVVGDEDHKRDLPVVEGQLDREKFKTLVESAAKAEGQYVQSLQPKGYGVTGMGAPADMVIDAKESERLAAREKDDLEQSIRVYESIGLDRKAAEFAAKGRVA